MRILSADVDRAIQIALEHGNEIEDISEGWSTARQVISMKHRLARDVREAIESALPKLRYWTANGTPHDAPSEGFISDTDRVGVSFPREQRARWEL